MSGVRDMVRFWTLAALAGAIVGCSGGDTTASKESAVLSAPQPEFIQLKGENIYVMVIPNGADPADLQPWAKERCGEVEFCKVFGWSDRASAARALPLTDAEAASQAFSYGVNRASGYESALWDCKRYPQSDPARCLSS